VTQDEALLAWLRVALTAARELTEQLSANGRPDPLYRFEDGRSGPSLGPRAFLDGVKVDEALVAEHTTGGKPWCSRCVPDRDALGEPPAAVGPCRTLVFVAARYRSVIPGWRGEWAT